MDSGTAVVQADRTAHWIKLNHQNRVPKRWIALDTESVSSRNGDTETQTWSMGAAIRWRTDLKTGDAAESATFTDPVALWQWVSEYGRKGMRTVVCAHNLGYDIRISQALTILPQLGYTLEWCNLDSNVSSMTWRSDHGTLVFLDTWTWLPLDLHTVAPLAGLRKLSMPHDRASRNRWLSYCMRDAEIVYKCVRDLQAYIIGEDLGNWQPTGAGMAYATWRHRFLTSKILVHADTGALTAERAAMHAGRAEAWRHGEILGDVWTEVDMRNAYTTIAAECDLPVKLRMRTGAISNAQYDRLCANYRVLARADVDTCLPCVPMHRSGRTLWPAGRFQTWLWDTEVQIARESGASISVREAYVYTRAPVLSQWAQWVLSVLRDADSTVSPVVRTWLKHCSRALIGRIALRCPQWELFGGNPEAITGITHVTDVTTGQTSRMLHIGDRTFSETARAEGRDSLPQITGWIMAECRARLWRAMTDAGLDEIAHVDTDSLIVSRRGYVALRAARTATWADHWQPKGSYRRMIIHGPRNYRADRVRKVAGVPRRAEETLPNLFHGERWLSLSTDLSALRAGSVTIEDARWALTRSDPRRADAPGVATRTVAYAVAASADVSPSSSASVGDGE